MNKKENQKRIQDHHRKMEINGLLEAVNRARSITVGSCFGGTIEISMRRTDGSNTFAIMQPVEVIELIHQLAASAGCHIHIQPRKDFASWRDWKYTEEELAHFRGEQFLPRIGHPPHSNDVSLHNTKGASLPPPDKQPGYQYLISKGKQDEDVATENHIHE